ncbi:MAG: hypothetical protein AAFP81_07210 [Pseudomonadota bacterium]
MTVFPDPSYFTWWTLIGWSWSVAAYYLMFSARGRAILANPLLILMAAILLFGSLRYVFGEMQALSLMAGGITPLDGQFGYGITEVIAFADALGEDGRDAYAVFQLGADALAPPAFVCFLMTVYRSTVQSSLVRLGLTVLAFTYFTSVLIANTFMPVIMQNFPDADAGLLPLYYSLIPKLDLIKYLTHGVAWLVIFSGWGWQGFRWSRRRFSQPAS